MQGKTGSRVGMGRALFKYNMFELSKRKINCSTFLSKEASIGALYRYIFEAESFQDKTMRSYELLDETENLLSCSFFNKNKDQCRMCRRICKFREKTINQMLVS